MSRTRLAALAIAVPTVFLLAACSSSGHHTVGPPPRHTRSASPAPSPSPTASPTPSASPTAPTIAAPTPSPTPSTCAEEAAHTFLHITSAKAGTGGSLTVTGNPTTMICGGADDFHFDEATSTVTGHVLPGATIMVFPLPTGHPVPIAASKLSSYLATDDDTRVFLVTGPLRAITGLQEQFHP